MDNNNNKPRRTIREILLDLVATPDHVAHLDRMSLRYAADPVKSANIRRHAADLRAYLEQKKKKKNDE